MLNIQSFLNALPLMGKGILGVFAVIAVVYVAIIVMRRFTQKKGAAKREE